MECPDTTPQLLLGCKLAHGDRWGHLTLQFYLYVETKLKCTDWMVYITPEWQQSNKKWCSFHCALKEFVIFLINDSHVARATIHGGRAKVVCLALFFWGFFFLWNYENPTKPAFNAESIVLKQSLFSVLPVKLYPFSVHTQAQVIKILNIFWRWRKAHGSNTKNTQ